MTRLLVLVEGQTEETFVNALLSPHLGALGIWASVRRLGRARARLRRGGIVGWPQARDEIVNNLKRDRRLYVTTMVDYYGLPHGRRGPWPRRADAASLPVVSERPVLVEGAVHEEIAAVMGSGFLTSRFVPFVVLHEFEALLFSDCDSFARAVGQPALASCLQAIRDQFSGPEEINDSNVTVPSKRLDRLIPGYSKPRMGLLASRAIGLEAMRSQCPHFGSWLDRLERLPSGAPTRPDDL